MTAPPDAAADTRYGQLQVSARRQWRDWLVRYHQLVAGVWVSAAAGTGSKVRFGDLVEEALCFGWTHGTRRRPATASGSAVLMAPRRAGSVWSALDRRRIAELTAAGSMAAAGHLAVLSAQQDGSWTALELVECLLEEPH